MAEQAPPYAGLSAPSDCRRKRKAVSLNGSWNGGTSATLRGLIRSLRGSEGSGLNGFYGNREIIEMDGFLRFNQIRKDYQEGRERRPVLVDISQTIGKGESIAILGKSGSGKTTLLNIISGIDAADGGDVILNGENLTAMNDLQRTLFRRRNIGFVFQFFNLISTLSILDNVMLPLELNNQVNHHGKQIAQDMLNEVGLLDRQNAYPDQLSGGEQQRVAIARALVHNPLLVLADEPTGNLDEENGRSILTMLDRLTRTAGKNLIMVTHSPEAAGHADRVLYLKGGKLISEEDFKDDRMVL
jgi:putative ABC transport system ATP-binding protein